MMRKVNVGTLVIGLLLIIPITTFAEDASVQGTTDVSVTLDNSDNTPLPPPKGSKPVPVLYKMDQSGKPSQGRGAPPQGMTPRGHATTTSGTKPLSRSIEMRDKMMASGTRPLFQGIEDRMGQRDADRMRMMGSDTPERRGNRGCGDDASSTDCGMRERMAERKGDALKHVAGVVVFRFEAAIKRFTILADRIDSRVSRLKKQGVDTTQIEADVTLARSKIEEAQDNLAAARALVSTAAANSDASSTISVDAGKPVRDQLEKSKQALIEAAKALGDAVRLLKAASGTGSEDNMHGTTSPKLPGMMRMRDQMGSGTPDGHPDGSM